MVLCIIIFYIYIDLGSIVLGALGECICNLFFFFLFLFDWKQFVLIESKTKLAEQKSSNAIIRYTNGKEKTRLLTNVISLPWLLKLHILIYEWIM